jgi:serine protease AprX
MSGTSMSAPVITGAVAQLLDSRPELNPDQVKYLLMNYGDVIYKDREFKFSYLEVDDVIDAAGYRTPTANTGLNPSKLLFTGDPEAWNSVAWNSVAWNSVAWNSVAWNSVAWNSVAWNSVAWNSVSLDSGIFWGPTRGPSK